MLTITVYDSRMHRQWSVSESKVRVGHGTGDEDLVVVPADEAADASSLLCRLGTNRIMLKNCGLPWRWPDGRAIGETDQIEIDIPAQLFCGDSHVAFSLQGEPAPIDEFLVPLDPVVDWSTGSLVPVGARPPGVETLSAWFHSLTDLQRTSGGQSAFFRDATHTVLQPGGLDGGMLLLMDGFEPRIAASSVSNPGQGFHFRADLVNRVIQQRKTLFHDATRFDNDPGTGCRSAVVAAPIINNDDEVTGVLYGWRSHTAANQRRGIRPLEAHFVHLVAQTVGATLERIRKETEIAEKNALLSQAFPERVVRQLQEDPAIFEGREKVVTTMYADLRGFSAISERIAPRITYQMIVDLMDTWTQLVLNHDGAVVDYFGDGLVAFWNAPLEVENHASLAVDCGHQMRQTLPEFNETWSHIVGCELDAGIGITTGLAQVGNCGSRHRFKYGPHGASVNLAARIEKLTRSVGCPILVAEETAEQIRNDYLVRRLGRVTVRGFSEPVTLYEPWEANGPETLQMIHRYEDALEFYEAGQLDAAVRILVGLTEHYPRDLPALNLKHSIQKQLRYGSTRATPLLPGSEDDRR
ncbi:MAG: adenylate/guanylate cyclase domain-containing protein [Pirellulaceae bacterium]